MKRRKLLLGVLASTAGIAFTTTPADAQQEKKPAAAEEQKPKPPPNPKPCTWKTGNAKPPPCKD